MPNQVMNKIWVFPPNNDCNGARSWWIACEPEPVLVDCPVVNDISLEFLKRASLGRPARIVLTSREAHCGISELQKELGWKVLVQEQEAYLLPEIKNLETFSEEFETPSGLRLLWTPGPTPGSCVVFAPLPWNVVFCGRLLIPLKSNLLGPFRTKRTFHWTRQQKSLKKLCGWLPLDPRPSLASGAGLQGLGGGSLFAWKEWEK